MAGFKDHFSGHAALYADSRPSYPPALARALAELAPSTALALECGCGSGQLSTVLGDVFDRVEATDASAEQVGQAKPHPHVTYRVAPAEKSGLPDGSCDLVVAAQAAHWFDLPAYWVEVARVLKPGGLTALVGYAPPRVNPALDVLMDAFYHEGIGRFWPPERLIVDNAYKGVDFPFREVEAPRHDLTADWNRHRYLGYVASWSAVKLAEKQGLNPLPAFADAVAADWHDAEEVRPIRWPVLMRIGYSD
ncbi:SAM-dependent methyltransferase [Skermanella stibiiresistens SB22]|uniref:SAM-dependent methyltransferase n=1 Tax=Skermanella stibiiresistens SB22 TaxID=1385369 RepID=W9HBA8_9PROT|nr:class I SAM-dependent methyltransferase [Skermanella stibiiresistens]EWY42031.1 SAM-dependent methyltransferase [Skermanella stibiiresistens SB22]